MLRVLFVCSRNLLRSPTAEEVFRNWPGIEVASAGTETESENPLGPDLLEWADIVIAMESSHRRKIRQTFGAAFPDLRIVCLNIPDRYDYMDPELVERLKAVVPRHLAPRRDRGRRGDTA